MFCVYIYRLFDGNAARPSIWRQPQLQWRRMASHSIPQTCSKDHCLCRWHLCRLDVVFGWPWTILLLTNAWLGLMLVCFITLFNMVLLSTVLCWVNYHAWVNTHTPIFNNMKDSFILYLVFRSGFPVEPGKTGDFNFICPGPKIAWNLPTKVWTPRQNKKFSRKYE